MSCGEPRAACPVSVSTPGNSAPAHCNPSLHPRRIAPHPHRLVFSPHPPPLPPRSDQITPRRGPRGHRRAPPQRRPASSPAPYLETTAPSPSRRSAACADPSQPNPARPVTQPQHDHPRLHPPHRLPPSPSHALYSPAARSPPCRNPGRSHRAPSCNSPRSRSESPTAHRRQCCSSMCIPAPVPAPRRPRAPHPLLARHVADHRRAHLQLRPRISPATAPAPPRGAPSFVSKPSTTAFVKSRRSRCIAPSPAPPCCTSPPASPPRPGVNDHRAGRPPDPASPRPPSPLP